MQLTTTEYNEGYSAVLKTFAASQATAWEEQAYKVRRGYRPNSGQLLYLFSYALSTWEHSDSAINYLTEIEVISIISLAKQVQWN